MSDLIRQFEQQTTLERVLRSHLWQPTDSKRSAEERLPGHVKRKEYSQAADCQKTIRESESQIKDWTYILDLYESEFHSSQTIEELGKAVQ